MGKRAEALGALLGEFFPLGPKPPRPGEDTIALAGLAGEVAEVFGRLDGKRKAPRLQPGPWDFAFDGWVLELDEENHFNRYRATTLDSVIYREINSFDLGSYRRYCENFEAKCSTHGGYWANSSAEREFGPAGERGILTGPGSPRWKQRAFYDFVKDLAPLTEGVITSRIAIWDTVTVDGETLDVGRILKLASDTDLSGTGWPESIVDLVESRMVRSTSSAPPGLQNPARSERER